jgi:hypothetical protein
MNKSARYQAAASWERQLHGHSNALNEDRPAVNRAALSRRHEGRVLINRDCSAIAGAKRRVRIAPEAQATF